MKRRPYQIGHTDFSIAKHTDGWWVVERWTEIDRRGEKADDFEDVGPFPSQEAAETELARMMNL